MFIDHWPCVRTCGVNNFEIHISYHSSFKPLAFKLDRYYLQLFIYGSEKAMAPTPVVLPGKSHGRRSLVGCSPWGRWESNTTERLHFHFSLSCIGEGNGNPLQCSCLENPRDGGACWAAIYGVAQSRIWLKQLSSSSSTYGCWNVLTGLATKTK